MPGWFGRNRSGHGARSRSGKTTLELEGLVLGTIYLELFDLVDAASVLDDPGLVDPAGGRALAVVRAALFPGGAANGALPRGHLARVALPGDEWALIQAVLEAALRRERKSDQTRQNLEQAIAAVAAGLRRA
jgi:hypothetical protein